MNSNIKNNAINIFKKELLKGKNIFVTGASSGIGASASSYLSNLGANLILSGRDFDRLNELNKTLTSKNNLLLKKDFNENKSVHDLLNKIPEKFLPLDGLFHAAGECLLEPLVISNLDNYHKLASSSLYPLLSFSKFFHKKKYFSNNSSIVLMSSVASVFSSTGMGYYSAIKSAINSITKSLAIELSNREIRVNAILAGAVETSMHDKISTSLSKESLQKYKEKHLLGFGNVNDISPMVCYLMSPASKWITGSLFTLDGGYSSFK